MDEVSVVKLAMPVSDNVDSHPPRSISSVTTSAETAGNEPATTTPQSSGSKVVAIDSSDPDRAHEADVRLQLEDAIHTTCPHCGGTNAGAGLALNLSFGPIQDSIQVICVRPGASMKAVTDQVRRTLLVDALRRTRGNNAEAARILGMKYSTFYALARRLLGTSPVSSA